MTPWEIKLLKGEDLFFHHLDSFIDRHPLMMMMAVIYLLLALLVLVIVSAARHRAKGRVHSGRYFIYIPLSTPRPPPAEPPFDPFPPMRERDYEI